MSLDPSSRTNKGMRPFGLSLRNAGVRVSALVTS